MSGNIEKITPGETPEEELLLLEKKDGEDTNNVTKEDKVQLKASLEVPEALHSPTRRLTDIAVELYGSEETTCGFGCLKGRFLQRFANKKAYVILYGVLGAVMNMSYSYLNSTITTLEKQFKIPSTNTGIILTGADFSQLLFGIILNYYGGRGHRPRWIAFGVYTVVMFCFMNALPFFLYGPGEEYLVLTEEYGSHLDPNGTAALIDSQNRKALCQSGGGEQCSDATKYGNFTPQLILFCAQVVSGIGGSLYYTLGVAYMDDNTKKSKSPALVSFSFFLRMLGPACGFALGSACLSLFVSPSLTPTITTKDPRWLGAWWLGWLIIGSLLIVFGSVLALFPRSLPRALARKVQASERRKEDIDQEPEMPANFKDMKKTFMRLVTNKALMCNCFASIFYIFGYIPFWLFMPKYIETIYKKSASAASMITGSVGLLFSAIGILTSGLVISKFRPSARFLAAWNVLVGAITAVGAIGYMYIGCPVNDRQGSMLSSGLMDTTTSCNVDCHCDYVKYSPVCSPDGRTFISPCHAGCRDYHVFANGSKVFTDCACVPVPAGLSSGASNVTLGMDLKDSWVITEGQCPIDCTTNFYIFLAIVCIFKFSGATGMTSNFLVSIRCVDEKDKATAMGVGLSLMALLAFIPAPILFGYLIDKTCLVWGKTCSGTGNCWLYNAEMLSYTMNLTAAGFITVGTLFDIGVWFYVKNVKIFDDEAETESSTKKPKTEDKS